MIKFVGNTQIQEKHLASCHCGAVKLELALPNGIEKPRRCDCSICRRKGAIVASVALDGIRIVEGALTLKQRNIISALFVVSTRIINADRIPMNMVLISDALKE